MKTGIASAVIALVMPVCVFATTLRLSTDIDLLVLDGKSLQLITARCRQHRTG
jgi:uncharacterized protein YccT (UPF0319 family)